MLSLLGQSPSVGSKNIDLDSNVEFVISSSVSSIELLGIPSSLSAFELAGFSKSVDVFGIYILATDSTPDSKVIHTANVLAQCLDNDQDGDPDNEIVLDEILDRGSVILMARDLEDYSDLDSDDWTESGYLFYEVLFSDEVLPSDDTTDGAIKTSIQFLIKEGYANAYSDIFNLGRGSIVSEYMDASRDGYYRDAPDEYSDDAWFHDLDSDCDYSCQISEYLYFAISSIMGSNEDRCEELADVWDLCTEDLVEGADPDIYSLINNSTYSLPTNAPDGNYSPSAGKWIDLGSLIVNINGHSSISGGEFVAGYDGPGSEITPEGDSLLVSIDPEAGFGQGEVVWVKIQVKDLDGKYLNDSYVFKAVSAEPVFIKSSPSNNSTISSAQVIYLEFEDRIDYLDAETINVAINGLIVVSNGEFQKGYSGDSSKIDEVSGYSDYSRAYVRIDPEEPIRSNDYIITYSIMDLNGNKLSGKFEFIADISVAVLPAAFPQTGFVGFFQGVKKISDIGIGDSLQLEWPTIAKRYYGSDAFILIYENEERLDVFDNDPSYIAPSSASDGIIGGLSPGVTLSYGIRALEAYKDTLSLDGMDSAGENIYSMPGPVSIADTVLADDTRITVDSVDGFPSKGILLLGGTEVIKYNSISESTSSFLLSSKSRGLSSTSPSVHLAGDEVKLFLACQDSNAVIVSGTPTYHHDVSSGREIENVGLVVTDYSDNDRKFFQGFDFCGYHRPLPQHILQGKNDCGSYLGGEFDGMRGMNLFDRMLNREEVLLDQTGEPVILLKRVWSGETCSCSDSRRVHPKIRDCVYCYGTGYAGGYEQYINRRREDSLVMISYSDTQEDLSLEAHKSLQQEYEPQCWTLPIPAVRDRDLIVRFDFTGDIEYMYEVLHVTKEKIIYKHYSRQRLMLKRLDKTDIVYTFPFLKGD